MWPSQLPSSIFLGCESIMTDLERKLIEGLLIAKARLHEMQVRRSCTPAELVGHFCTELRRLYLLSAISDAKLWNAPLVPATYGWPKAINYQGLYHNVSLSDIINLCKKADSMSEEDIALTHQLSVLEAQIPAINLKTTEVERLTRKTTDLVTEAEEFASQLEHRL